MSYHARARRSGILFAARNPLKADKDVPLLDQELEVPSRSLNLTNVIKSRGQDAEISKHSEKKGDNYSVFPVFDERIDADSGFQPLGKPITLCLPILSITIDVTVDGTVAITRLTQSFYNPSELVISEARYTFPIYNDAVATSFDCNIGNERRLQGVVKSKVQARRDFEDHRYKKGETAALLEELTPEIFETSLGNIPARTTIDIRLTYVEELKVVTSQKEKAEGLALTIPTSIAPRYGTARQAMVLPKLPHDKLNINIKVRDNGSLDANRCHIDSGHLATYQGSQPIRDVVVTSITELSTLDLTSESPKQVEHIWDYSEAEPLLWSDFVMFIQTHEDVRLRSRAFVAPINDVGHAALMVNLRPNDIFGSAIRPELFGGEVLFVLDQSDSMGWTHAGNNTLKINAMKDAMSLALSGLPFGCRFNIISFGSEVRGMWFESQSASDFARVQYATTYVSMIESNMGGTDILLALNAAVENRTRDSSSTSTQIILLTDGEVEQGELEPISKFILDTRKEHGIKIRFFTLGLGDRVSHSVVETIANLGGGYCDVIDPVKKPRWEDRLNRMLLSVMEPDSWTFDVDLGAEYERQDLVAQKFWMNDQPNAHVAAFAQAPYPIPPLHPYRYRSLFFLLRLGDLGMPKSVKITTTAASAKKKDYYLDVEPTLLGQNMIHPMAVKMILKSLEDELKSGDLDEELARANAEFLGTTYAVTSKWTSFVAVTEKDDKHIREVDIYKAAFKDSGLSRSRNKSQEQMFSLLDRINTVHPDTEPNRDSMIDTLRAENTTLIRERDALESEVHDLRRRVAASSESDYMFSGGSGETSNGLGRTRSKRHESQEQKSRLLERINVVDQNTEPRNDSTRRRRSSVSQPRTPFTRETLVDDRTPRDPPLITRGFEYLENNHTATSPTIRAEAGSVSPPRSVTSSMNTFNTAISGDYVPEPLPPKPKVGSKNSSSRKHRHYDDSSLLDHGYITWKHAEKYEERGMFVLPEEARVWIHQHFCPETLQRMRENLQNLKHERSAVLQGSSTLIDTLLMIQYFKTHLAQEEDYWSLIIGKATHTVLTALGFDESQEESLNPLFEMLSSAISHVHFEEAIKNASVTKSLPETPLASSKPEICLVCDTPIDKKYEGLPATKDFVCLADGCYDGSSRSRTRFSKWAEFWSHQVKSGHLLCPDHSRRRLLMQGGSLRRQRHH